jgi:hypothetical protein
VVLDAGHYTVRAWLPKAPTAGCSVDLDLVSGTETTYRADFDRSGRCEWVPAKITDYPGAVSP